MPEIDASVQVTEMTFDGVTPVDSYGPGFFRIDGQVIKGSILLSPGGVAGWGGYTDLAGITDAADDIDILLVGAGAEIAPLPNDFQTAVEALNIGVEVMATPAACRTFNVLLAEGRRVALAMVPV